MFVLLKATLLISVLTSSTSGTPVLLAEDSQVYTDYLQPSSPNVNNFTLSLPANLPTNFAITDLKVVGGSYNNKFEAWLMTVEDDRFTIQLTRSNTDQEEGWDQTLKLIYTVNKVQQSSDFDDSCFGMGGKKVFIDSHDADDETRCIPCSSVINDRHHIYLDMTREPAILVPHNDKCLLKAENNMYGTMCTDCWKNSLYSQFFAMFNSEDPNNPLAQWEMEKIGDTYTFKQNGRYIANCSPTCTHESLPSFTDQQLVHSWQQWYITESREETPVTKGMQYDENIKTTAYVPTTVSDELYDSYTVPTASIEQEFGDSCFGMSGKTLRLDNLDLNDETQCISCEDVVAEGYEADYLFSNSPYVSAPFTLVPHDGKCMLKEENRGYRIPYCPECWRQSLNASFIHTWTTDPNNPLAQWEMKKVNDTYTFNQNGRYYSHCSHDCVRDDKKVIAPQEVRSWQLWYITEINEENTTAEESYSSDEEEELYEEEEKEEEESYEEDESYEEEEEEKEEEESYEEADESYEYHEESTIPFTTTPDGSVNQPEIDDSCYGMGGKKVYLDSFDLNDTTRCIPCQDVVDEGNEAYMPISIHYHRTPLILISYDGKCLLQKENDLYEYLVSWCPECWKKSLNAQFTLDLTSDPNTPLAQWEVEKVDDLYIFKQNGRFLSHCSNDCAVEDNKITYPQGVRSWQMWHITEIDEEHSATSTIPPTTTSTMNWEPEIQPTDPATFEQENIIIDVAPGSLLGDDGYLIIIIMVIAALSLINIIGLCWYCLRFSKKTDEKGGSFCCNNYGKDYSLLDVNC